MGICVNFACISCPWQLKTDNALHLSISLRLNLQLASFDIELCKGAVHHQVAHLQLLIPN